MKNEMIVFESQEFGKLTVVEIEGKPWFIGREVATMLGYTDTAQAVKLHCKYVKLLKNVDTTFLEIAPRGIQIINEKDIYRLIMRSKLPSAERFQDWVCDEILPSIRKTGSYNVHHTTIANSLEDYLRIADLFEIPKHLGQIEAKKQVEQIHKVNLSPFLQLAPAQNNIKEDEVMLEPTELAKELKVKSASAMNKILAHKGLQVKTELGWIATEKGQPYCSKHSWTSRTKSGYNYKWNAKKIKSLFSKGSLF